MRSGRVRSFCSTCGTCHVTFATNTMISNKFLHNMWNYYCYSSLAFLTVNVNSSMITLSQVSERTSSCLLAAAARCLLRALWQSPNTGHVLTSISKYEFRIEGLYYARKKLDSVSICGRGILVVIVVIIGFTTSCATNLSPIRLWVRIPLMPRCSRYNIMR